MKCHRIKGCKYFGSVFIFIKSYGISLGMYTEIQANKYTQLPLIPIEIFG